MIQSGEPACFSRPEASRAPKGHGDLRRTLCVFLVAGIFFTLINLSLPIARNALCYGKAALGIVQHHFDLFTIVRNSSWTSGKPIFFSAFAAPFVWLFDMNTGIIFASAAGTAFFLWTVTLALPRL